MTKTLLIAVVVLILISIESGLPWWFGLIVVAICTIASYAFAILVFSGRTILDFGRVKELLKWDDCTHCTSGTQWWNGSSWGPIPESVRVVQKGKPTFEPPQANVRKCMYCGTKGGWWTPRLPKAEPPPEEISESEDTISWWDRLHGEE